MDSDLKKISLHLLDLGKRNRLLNYKDSGLKTIDVLNSNTEVLFQKVTGSNKLSVFKLDPILKKYETTISNNNVKVEEFSVPKVKEITESLLKANDVLCYKKGYALEKVIKNIYKEYKESLIERGIHTLYMTFGLVGYEDRKEHYDAPLLLIPIEMSNENGIYSFHEAEDDILLNPTLAYLLKTEKKLVLEEYHEHETDFMTYFLNTSNLLKEYNMSLRIHSSIGIYSFLKMNMFNDLNEHAEIVLQNKNILRLLGRNVESDVLDEDEKIYPVVNADSSQLEAISYAASGASFVLQGPPGSGKSQTITNIIATMLGNGKKVLFVSEKQAALNVVYENLRRAGLESFALELHSHKANKKEIIDELYKTACLPHYDIKNDAYHMGEKYSYLTHKLEDYRQCLHQNINRLNVSLYDIYSKYLSLPVYSGDYHIEHIETKSVQQLDEVKDLLNQYARLSRALGRDYHQGPFYGFQCKNLDFIRFEAKTAFLNIQTFLHQQLDFLMEINRQLPLNLKSYFDLVENIEFLNHFAGLHFFLENYFNKRKRDNLLDDLELYFESKKYLEKSTISHFIDLNIQDYNPANLLYRLKLTSKSKLKFLSMNYHRVKKEIRVFTKIKMKDKDLIEKLEEVLVYQKKTDEMKTALSHLPVGYRVYEYELMYEDVKGLKNLPFDLALNEKEYQELRNSFLTILMKYHHQEFILKDYIAYFDSEIIDIMKGDLKDVVHKIDTMTESVDLLDLHAERLDVLNRLEEEQVLSLVNEIIQTELPLEQLCDIYESRWMLANIYYELDQNPILKEFSGLGIDALIDEFKNLEERHFDANRAMIVSKLSKLRPDDSIMAGSKFAILIKEYNKLRKQKPIRVLLEEIFDLILDIKPVFLMSPLSVSTYLNSKLDLFDLVVFDEASQVFAWDALGAIYRAKQCIIIGDSKQMPPFSFFTTVAETENEDSYENELESILDKSSGIFTTKRLNWHYRSRSEELIAFSNGAFYENRLITIPQAKGHEEGFGIDFCYLKDGIYDIKTRTNYVEAKKIVELVWKHFDTNPKESLGVVAFSNTQAELISDLIEEELLKKPQYKQFFDEQQNEPFFVKNLETVQGDERDKIIFSICYGYNQDHRFYQRFGPLNNIGGERRLNVAITRAKYNICVVSSILSSDIRLDNTESLGVRLLKEYLDYAAHVTTPKHATDHQADGVCQSITNYLQEQGFLVEQHVGTSSFKIDIAVLHPVTNEYMVAIMLDGPSYQIGNCSDVNYLQEILLNRLGWHFYRIFSTKWIQNENIEKERLIDFLTKVFQHQIENRKQDDQKGDTLLVEDEDNFTDEFKTYTLVSDEKIKTMYYSKKTYQIIDYIVSKEEPIHKEYLLKRICFMYGRTKVTNIVRELFEADLEKLKLICENEFLMHHPIDHLELRVSNDRMMEYVHPLELKDAIYKVVKHSNGITKEGCFKTIVKLLGYNRMSENSIQYLEDALVMLKLDGKVVEKQDCLYV